MGWLAAIPALAGLLGDVFGGIGEAKQENKNADFINAQNRARYQTWLPYAQRDANQKAFLSGAFQNLIKSPNNPLRFETGKNSLASSLGAGGNLSGLGGALRTPISFPTDFPGGIYPGVNIPGIIGRGLKTVAGQLPVGAPGGATATGSGSATTPSYPGELGYSGDSAGPQQPPGADAVSSAIASSLHGGDELDNAASQAVWNKD